MTSMDNQSVVIPTADVSGWLEAHEQIESIRGWVEALRNSALARPGYGVRWYEVHLLLTIAGDALFLAAQLTSEH